MRNKTFFISTLIIQLAVVFITVNNSSSDSFINLNFLNDTSSLTETVFYISNTNNNNNNKNAKYFVEISSDNQQQQQLESPTENYTNFIELVGQSQYLLYWSSTNTDITFEIHVKTDGWVGFGLSENGYMEDSDVIIAWINKDGFGNFTDRHIEKVSIDVKIDRMQNWLPVHAAKKNAYSIFKFTRRLIICDDLSDKNISTNGNYIIFSWGNLISNGLLDYHSKNRGSKFINLIENINLPTCLFETEFDSYPTEVYENYVELVKNKFRFYWNITDKILKAEIHVKTNGWIGFGLSPNGQMDGSDVLIGWISNGQPYLTDQYIYNRKVLPDLNNDLKLLYANENGPYTVFKYQRDILLCDPDDRSIEPGSPYVIYAWGDDDPIDEFNINYHSQSNMGSRPLEILKTSVLQSNEIYYGHIDFNISYVLFPTDGEDSVYCKSFEIPKDLQKNYIYKWEFILPDVNSENIKTIRIYECVEEFNTIIDGNCEDNDNLVSMAHCSLSALEWNYGADTIINFPKNTGYPIGDRSDYSYIILSIEYNDPQKKIGYFTNFALRAFMTNKLPEHELGGLILGAERDPLSILIPPGVDLFPITTYCFNTCLNKMVDNIVDNITVVMGSPHTRSAGVHLWTRVNRKGSEVGYLHYNKYYNYSYQNFYTLVSPFTIFKDDNLVTRCIYSTKNKSKLIKGGLGQDKETCSYNYFYYPRVKNLRCMSFPSVDDQLKVFSELKKDGYVNFNELSKNDPNNISARLSSLYDAYQSLEEVKNFTDYLIQKIYSIYESSRFNPDCGYKINESFSKLTSNNSFKEIDKCNFGKQETKILSIESNSSSKLFLFNFYLNILLILSLSLSVVFL